MTSPFVLTPLGDLAEIAAGGGAPQNSDDFGSDGYPFVRAGSLRPLLEGEPESSFAHLTKDVAKSHRLRLFPAGSVLFAKSGMSATKGHIYRLRNSAFVVNHLAAVVCGEQLNSGYLHHCLRVFSPTRLIQDEAYPSIRLSDISAMRIPLPPLPEQLRIAAILDQADALLAKRREALAQLDNLTQSIFIKMFGDLMDQSNQWKPEPVSNFVAGFESGKSVAADDEDDATSSFRVLKVSAVTSLVYKPEESKSAPVGYTPPRSHLVKDGDLLFSRANTTDLIGATAYVKHTPPNLLLSDKLWRFIWYEIPRVEPIFVNFLFRQPRFRSEIGRRASGTSGSMKNISQDKVLSIWVGFPPLELQRKFSHRVSCIEQTMTSYKVSEEELDALFASLQYRTFRGEL